MGFISNAVHSLFGSTVSSLIGIGAGGVLSRLGLIAWVANRFDPEQLAFIDKLGGSIRPLHDLQYILADGTGYFLASGVTATGTITASNGTSTLSSPSAGRINMTAGTAWDFTVTWSDGKVSQYAFCSLVTATYAQCFDRSGNGRHLVATGFADLSLVCLSGKEFGSDALNLYGYSDGGLGPEKLINGDFSNGDTNWVKGLGWSINQGSAQGISASGDIYQSVSFISGIEYKMSFLIFDYLSGVLRPLFTGGTTATGSNVSGNGIYSQTLQANIGNISLTLYTYTDFSGRVDDVSLRVSYPSTTPIPASTTPGIDALGNALTYPGRSKYDLQPNSAPCVAFDGTGYLAVKKNGVAYTLTGSTIENGGTATLAISTSSITCAGTGTGFNIRITESGGNVITFPCSNGRGTGTSPNLIVHGYDTAGANYEATCTSFVSDEAIWSTQSEYFHGLTYGYSDGGLGPELITNEADRTFSSDTGYWSKSGGWSISEGYAVFDGITNGYLYRPTLLTAGKNYLITGNGSGNVTIPAAFFSSGVGTFSLSNFSRNVTPSTVEFRLYSTTTLGPSSLDEISIKLFYSSTVKIPANPYTPGLDCLGNALTTPPLKWNDSAYYTLPDADQIREALGWTYGTANYWFNGDGTSKELTLDNLYALGAGFNFYMGAGGLAVYDTSQIAKDASIERSLRIPAESYGDAFVMTFNIASDSETLTIPCQNVGTFNATIDWGDGSTSAITAYNDADLAHVYSKAGQYDVRISGVFPNIYFNNTGDKLKLIAIKNFGNTGFTRLNNAFYGCANLVSATSKVTNTSLVTNMYYMFNGCSSLTYLDVSGFNTSLVTGMGAIFYGCSSLTALDVSGFDTSLVTNMYSMFNDCSSLTALDVSEFDTSLVTNMYYMFNGCSSLTYLDVSGFDTSLVTNMDSMFSGCSSLIALDVSGFDTSLVTNMYSMFYGCSSLTTLDVSRFNIEAINNIANLTNFAYNVTIPTVNYDATLINWAAQNVFSGLTTHFGLSKYTPGGAAEAARSYLINTKGWTITDGGPVI